jgi:hypothetical protein
MVKKTVLPFLIVLLFTGCKNHGSPNNKPTMEMEVGILKMHSPKSYHFEVGQGIDSHAARLIDDRGDSLQIEYGEHGIIYSLYEAPPYAFPLEKKDEIVRKRGIPAASEAVFSKYPEDDNRKNIFDKNYYMYDTVNNIVVQFVLPKRIGQGMTGMFIPELKNGKSFSIYGLNLDSTEHYAALEIFRSIRYK